MNGHYSMPCGYLFAYRIYNETKKILNKQFQTTSTKKEDILPNHSQ